VLRAEERKEVGGAKWRLGKRVSDYSKRPRSLIDPSTLGLQRVELMQGKLGKRWGEGGQGEARDVEKQRQRTVKSFLDGSREGPCQRAETADNNEMCEVNLNPPSPGGTPCSLV